MIVCRTILLASLGLAFWPLGSAQAEEAIRSIAIDGDFGTAESVVVSGEVPLAHTSLVLPVDSRGQVVAPGQAEDQSRLVIERLQDLLGEVGSSLDQTVRLHVYAARPDVVAIFRDVLAESLSGEARPTITIVTGPLQDPEAMVAVDAIAVATRSSPDPRVAILKPGPRVFVSGQAEPAESMAEATRKTLESLEATLQSLDLGKSDIVQLKAFLKPTTDAEEVERAVAAFFGEVQAPPLVLVAWESASPPIEIELVASGGDRRGEAQVEYLTPPGMTASPVFCRVTVVRSGPLIFVGGLLGPEETSGQEQTRAVFTRLKNLLGQTGSDPRHLIKATYYVSDDESSRALNELRPDYYDPERPPAASKAMVEGVGLEGCGLSLDMIAVPASDAPWE